MNHVCLVCMNLIMDVFFVLWFMFGLKPCKTICIIFATQVSARNKCLKCFIFSNVMGKINIVVDKELPQMVNVSNVIQIKYHKDYGNIFFVLLISLKNISVPKIFLNYLFDFRLSTFF